MKTFEDEDAEEGSWLITKLLSARFTVFRKNGYGPNDGPTDRPLIEICGGI